jgi:hypothetical protein
VATKFLVLLEIPRIGLKENIMTVSLYVRVSVKGKRRYAPVNKKKIYPEGTIFCLRYARKWETLTADTLTAALAARAMKEAALLTEQPSAAKVPARRLGIDDAIVVYLSNTAARKKQRTLLAYTLATREFRKSCQQQFLDELTKQDLTDFVVFQKKQKLADRTIDNRLTDLGTFLHANSVALSLHQSYTEKKVRAYSIEELRALNATSTDEELQFWQFFLSTGFREDEVAHACYTDIDFKAKTIDVREKRQATRRPGYRHSDLRRLQALDGRVLRDMPWALRSLRNERHRPAEWRQGVGLRSAEVGDLPGEISRSPRAEPEFARG